MIKFNIRTLLASKGITEPQAFLIRIGISLDTAKRMISHNEKSQPKSISLKNETLICIHANCTPNDLRYWAPDSQHESKRTELHLQKMRDPTLPDVYSELKNLSTDELREIDAMLKEKKAKRKG